MPKARKKNPAALELAKLSVRARYKNLTAAQRSAQGRMAGASRRDRQPRGPWFGLLLLPTDYEWKGARHASKVLDEARADPQVICWSPDRAEVVARSQQDDLCDRVTLIVEQNWDPHAFTIKREYKPNVAAQVKALQSLVADTEQGGKP